MRILNRDELEVQRGKYLNHIKNLNKIAAGVGDGTLKGDTVRDMLLILQARLLTHILSELVHLSHTMWEMEDKIDNISYDAQEPKMIVEDQADAGLVGAEELEELNASALEYERGSTDLLGRFKGLGLIPDEEPSVEHLPAESRDDQTLKTDDEKLGGTAKLLAALAEIEAADTTDEAQRIVDNIHKLAEGLEDDKE
jgi:hypothetical protein